ncbi:DUF4365 domain-containing protein [Pseudoalteromonas ruthenica]|uniref:DUF4365 domain-containing protein n=1 Tax=Pseudoalteromonas ruthenica TaxID=151081 RepID=UPI00110AE6CA|nr:DUF4365 domain-containing protein [Pseudoalteromonas ruthenica]TMO46433.1 hypothetical protein CWC24_10045 [Pseudoalteromonas ruthenica]TMO50396.1 hypothetical protein CWC23_11740 [Pseudoalteromonas ruthenica]
MFNFLSQRPLPEIDISRDENANNGSDAETLAASKIVQATRGEIRWSSREEDNTKKDLHLSTKHPWHEKDRLEVDIQVKSGASNGSLTKGGFKVKKQAYKALLKKKNPTCLLWVDYHSGKVYWTYVHPNSNLDKHNSFSDIHLVTPSTLYDLARCQARHKGAYQRGGHGLQISSRSMPVAVLREKARNSIKKKNKFDSPVLGEILFTKSSWRHMFRASRNKSGKESSLRVIPQLSNILSRVPKTHFISDYSFTENREMVTRSTSHILKYPGATRGEGPNSEVIDLFIKVQEDVRYPKNWREKVLLSQLVDRQVTLVSCYYKASH